MNFRDSIDWSNVIKKEVRGFNDIEWGEVQEVKDNYIIIQKGLIDKEKFYIPKFKVESYDGKILKVSLFDINLNKFLKEPTNQRS